MMRKKLVTCTSTKKIGDIVTNSQLNMDSDREVTDIKTENLDEPDYLTTDMLDDIIGNKIDMNDCEMSERYTENKSATDTDKVPSVGVNLKKETNTTCNMKLNRIKPEQVKTENYDKCNLMTEVVEHIKKEDGEVMVKIEEAQLKAYVDKKEPYDDMDSIQLTEELDIKVDNDASTEKTSSPVSIRAPKMMGNLKLLDRKWALNLLSCHNCEFSTYYRAGLINHVKVHTNQSSCKVTYEHCNRIRKSRISTDNYIIEDHDYIGDLLNERTAAPASGCYACQHCDAIFETKTRLDSHILKKHPSSTASISSRIHECTYCSYKTTRFSSLSRHLWVHSRNQYACTNICTHCYIKFETKCSLDNHIVKNHPSFIKSITSKACVCSQCVVKTLSGKSNSPEVYETPPAHHSVHRLKNDYTEHVFKRKIQAKFESLA